MIYIQTYVVLQLKFSLNREFLRCTRLCAFFLSVVFSVGIESNSFVCYRCVTQYCTTVAAVAPLSEFETYAFVGR